jgi:hypothetical protein
LATPVQVLAARAGLVVQVVDLAILVPVQVVLVVQDLADQGASVAQDLALGTIQMAVLGNKFLKVRASQFCPVILYAFLFEEKKVITLVRLKSLC